MRLRLVVHITRSDAGYSATLDSPDQGANDIPITTVTFVRPDVTLGLPNLGAAYEGTLADQTIEGTWTQGGRSVPLTLSRKIDKQPGAIAMLAAGTPDAVRSTRSTRAARSVSIRVNPRRSHRVNPWNRIRGIVSIRVWKRRSLL